LAALLHGTLVVGVSQTAALSRGRHLYSAGRPSRWALAHILVVHETPTLYGQHVREAYASIRLRRGDFEVFRPAGRLVQRRIFSLLRRQMASSQNIEFKNMVKLGVAAQGVKNKP